MSIDLKIKQSLWALIFAFISMFILGLADNIRGPLFPEVLNYFSLSSAKGSWSFATASAAAFLGSYMSLYFLKRYSLASLLFLAISSMSLGLFVMGFSTYFYIFIIGSFFLGLGMGWLGVSQNLLVSESTSTHKSRALAGLHSVYGLASFLAPVLAANLTNQTETWRSSFIVIAVLCIVYLLFQFLYKADPAFGILKASELDQKDPLKVPWISLLSIGGLFAFYVMAEILIATRLAQYMRNYYNMDLLQSSQYVTWFFLFLLMGRMFYAFKKINIPIRKQMNISLSMSLILLILGLYSHPVVLALVGLTMAPFYPLSIAYISEIAHSHVRKFFTFAIAFQSLAIVSMHLGVGYLTDNFGLLYAFGVGIFALVLSLICLNFHPKKLY